MVVTKLGNKHGMLQTDPIKVHTVQNNWSTVMKQGQSWSMIAWSISTPCPSHTTYATVVPSSSTSCPWNRSRLPETMKLGSSYGIDGIPTEVFMQVSLGPMTEPLGLFLV